ncbi:MAG: hypothetical protein AAB465_00775 [Patescibacteria group bacterium]
MEKKIEKFSKDGGALIKPEVFDPILELQNIKKLPKNEQTEAFQEYKEKLIEQKENLAKMQEAIVALIRFNPDRSLDELIEKAQQFGDKFGFSEEQMETIKSNLRQYSKRHNLVKELRQRFPKDNELFKTLFGREPKGRIEIIAGPITLYFRCHDIDDYIYLFTYGFLKERELDAEKIEFVKQTNAAKLIFLIKTKVGDQEIASPDLVIIENASAEHEFTEEKQKTLLHEEQHAINSLLFPLRYNTSFPYLDLIEAKTKIEKELAFKRYFRFLRERYDNRAKDELLAYFKSGRAVEDILETLTCVSEEGGRYDYFDKDMQKQLVEQIFKGSIEQTPELKQIINDMVQEIFVREYRQTIKSGLNAFVSLRERGYSLEQTIALFQQEPLTKWPKLAKRFMDQ